MSHVGRTGSFVPVKISGGSLWRVKDGQKYAVTGTKGWRWITRDVAADLSEKGELSIDYTYFEELKVKAMEAVMQFDLAKDFTFDQFI